MAKKSLTVEGVTSLVKDRTNDSEKIILVKPTSKAAGEHYM